MIESLVNVFTRNNNLFSKKMDSPGGEFQQTLNHYDQQMSQQQEVSENTHSFSEQSHQSYEEDNYSGSEENTVQEDEYSTEESKSEVTEQNEETKEVSENEVAAKDDKDETAVLQPFFNLLEKIGVDKEAIAQIKELIQNPEKGLSKEDLAEFLKSLKSALKNNKNLALPEGLKEKVSEFAAKLSNLIQGQNRPTTGDLKQMVQNSEVNKSVEKPLAEKFVNQQEPVLENRVDKQIQLNNTKHAQMKEVAQQAGNVKFRTEVDPRLAENSTHKSSQNLQAKQLQLNLANAAQTQNQNPGQQQGGEADTEGKSPSFLQKMKTVLKTNSTPNNLQNDAVQADNPKVQTHGIRPSFMTRISSGSFLQQMVSKIQAMTKAGSTLSASVDFKSSDFGDMKLAAEAQGTSLAVKLSNISSTMRSDILSLKNELNAELRNLGFENIDLDFGDSTNDKGSHGFEDEMQKRLSGEFVKLPGDHIADLKAIDDWMKNAERVL